MHYYQALYFYYSSILSEAVVPIHNKEGNSSSPFTTCRMQISRQYYLKYLPEALSPFEISVTLFRAVVALAFCGYFQLRVHCISRTKVQTRSTCGGPGYLLRGCVFAARRQLCSRFSNLRLKGNLTTLPGARKTLVQRPTISYADSYHTRR